MIKFFKYWLPVFMWAAVIFVVSSIPGSSVPSLFLFQNITYHAIAFLVLAILLSRALKNTYSEMRTTKRFALVVIIGFIYALSDEFHQYFVPFRDPSILDVSVDSIGLLIGSLINYKKE